MEDQLSFLYLVPLALTYDLKILPFIPLYLNLMCTGKFFTKAVINGRDSEHRLGPSNIGFC